MQQYAWFIWSLIALVIWVIIYFSSNNKKERKEMLVLSLWISLFGLTQPLWVPGYWSPPAILRLPLNFDIESIIFSFGTGGIAVAIYKWIFPTISQPAVKHKYHLSILFSGPIVFIFLLFVSKMNHIYSAIIAMAVGGLFSFFYRPDLGKRMLINAGALTFAYFGYFLLLIVMFPNYVQRVWNLKALWEISIVGAPLEELIFAVCLGFLWPSIYEYIREHGKI